MCHVHIFLMDRLSMYENGEKIIDALIDDRKDLQGGRIGVFSMSQEKVTWSALSIACPTVEKRYVHTPITNLSTTLCGTEPCYSSQPFFGCQRMVEVISKMSCCIEWYSNWFIVVCM